MKDNGRTSKVQLLVHHQSYSRASRPPVLLGGKPHGSQTEDGKRGQWKDFGTEPQNGQKDKSIAKAVWLYFRERRGFGGQQVNYVTLSSYREHWERDLPGHRDLGDREIDGYQKVREKERPERWGPDDKWSLNFLKMKKLPERVLTHAFSACTTRWHQPPAVPATAAAALGRWLTQYLWVNK